HGVSCQPPLQSASDSSASFGGVGDSNLMTAQTGTARQRNSYCMGFAALKKAAIHPRREGLSPAPQQQIPGLNHNESQPARHRSSVAASFAQHKNRNSQRRTHHHLHHNSERLTFQRRSLVN